MKIQTECPYCLAEIETDDSTACESCGALHHRECWEENAGCAARNCVRSTRTLNIEIEPEQHSTIDLTRESIDLANPRRRGTHKNPCLKCGMEVVEGELYCDECKPWPTESDHVKNLIPMIVMLIILGVFLAWIINSDIFSNKELAPPPAASNSERTK